MEPNEDVDVSISTVFLMKYRFGFALTTSLGNKTRYINLRKYAERDCDVECVWAPIKHYIEGNPFTRYPQPVRHQLTLNQEAREIFQEWRNLDVVMVHAFQLFSLLSLKRFGQKKPVLVLSQDYAPFRDTSMMKAYGQVITDNWRRKLRYRLEVLFTRRADIYLPWSHWVKNILVNECGVSSDQIFVINVGVDLELWPFCPPEKNNSLNHILFVGGDFERKGGPLLLEVYRQHFTDVAHLHLVTRKSHESLPPNVHVYTDMQPNDPRLQNLYTLSDIFVLPTRADMSSLASLEAMATGRPVISSNVGGIPDIVEDGETGFLIEPDDGQDLRERIQTLLNNEELRHRMGRAGRKKVERELNAEVNASRILTIMKNVVDDHKQ